MSLMFCGIDSGIDVWCDEAILKAIHVWGSKCEQTEWSPKTQDPVRTCSNMWKQIHWQSDSKKQELSAECAVGSNQKNATRSDQQRSIFSIAKAVCLGQAIAANSKVQSEKHATATCQHATSITLRCSMLLNRIWIQMQITNYPHSFTLSTSIAKAVASLRPSYQGYQQTTDRKSHPLVNPHNYGQLDNYHLYLENFLFLWPCSIAMLVIASG